MWLIEPPIPAQEAPIYVSAKANASESKEKERVLGICSTTAVVTESKPDAGRGITPEIISANSYMKRYEHKPNFFDDGSNTTVRVVQQPTHGRLEFIRDLGYHSGYESLNPNETKFNAKNLIIHYVPEIGYDEMDSYAVEFKQNGVKVRVKYFVMVNSVLALPEKYCEIAPGRFRKGGEWKISLLPSQATDDLDSWLRATSLQATLSNAVSAVRGFRAAG